MGHNHSHCVLLGLGGSAKVKPKVDAVKAPIVSAATVIWSHIDFRKLFLALLIFWGLLIAAFFFTVVAYSLYYRYYVPSYLSFHSPLHFFYDG